MFETVDRRYDPELDIISFVRAYNRIRCIGAVRLITLLLVTIVGLASLGPVDATAQSSDLAPRGHASRIERYSTAALADAVARIDTTQLADRIGADWAEIVAGWAKRSRSGQACVMIEFTDHSGHDDRPTFNRDIHSALALLDRSSSSAAALPEFPAVRIQFSDVSTIAPLGNPAPLLPPPRF